MNFVEEQEELSLSIWAYCKLNGRRRQPKGNLSGRSWFVGGFKEKQDWGETGNENIGDKQFGIQKVTVKIF